jgi:hypothetical protein
VEVLALPVAVFTMWLLPVVLLAQASPSPPRQPAPPRQQENVRCINDSFGNLSCSDGTRIIKDSFGNWTVIPPPRSLNGRK